MIFHLSTKFAGKLKVTPSKVRPLDEAAGGSHPLRICLLLTNAS